MVRPMFNFKSARPIYVAWIDIFYSPIFLRSSCYSMPQHYSNGNRIYLVDMMFAYINIFKPKSETVTVESLLYSLEHKSWGDPETGEKFSPLDAIADPTNKKYKREIDKIATADLSYPIIIGGGHLVDGKHRLTKAMQEGRIKIKAYIFTDREMNKFLINKSRDWDAVKKIQLHDIIRLFYDRFTVR